MGSDPPPHTDASGRFLLNLGSGAFARLPNVLKRRMLDEE